MLRPIRSNPGFTLIEIVIIIIVLGIIAAVAIPKYQDLTNEARIAATRSALGNLRSGIAIYYANKAVKTGTASWPPMDSLEAPGVIMINSLPVNPYQDADSAPDSIVTGVTKGVTVGTRGGWAYNPATGEIWANTRVNGENDW
jgi:prepilin-type N-terminal cleavage/methylation domain-containing protein